MFLKRLALTGLLGGLALGTAACTDGYGYSGLGVGYGAAYGGDPYYDGYGGGWGGGGLANAYYGWNNNFYYPGTGVYVYDQYRRPHRWNGAQQRYWQGRRNGWGDRDVRANWGDFRRDVSRELRDYRGDVRDARRDFRQGDIDRSQLRDRRQDARREYRGDVRQDYRDLRRENRAEGVRTPRPNRAFRPRGPR